MLEAKNVKCGNLVDVDSNLNNVYQHLEALRELQTQTLYLRSTTAQYMGANSSYNQITFTNSITNFSTSALSFNSADSTINVDPSVYTDFKINLSMQFYAGSNNPDSTKTIYIRIKEIDANGNEAVQQVPFFREAIGNVTSDGLRVISFGQLLAFRDTTKKIKLEATTNGTTAPSINSIHFDITGITRSMN